MDHYDCDDHHGIIRDFRRPGGQPAPPCYPLPPLRQVPPHLLSTSPSLHGLIAYIQRCKLRCVCSNVLLGHMSAADGSPSFTEHLLARKHLPSPWNFVPGSLQPNLTKGNFTPEAIIPTVKFSCSCMNVKDMTASLRVTLSGRKSQAWRQEVGSSN